VSKTLDDPGVVKKLAFIAASKTTGNDIEEVTEKIISDYLSAIETIKRQKKIKAVVKKEAAKRETAQKKAAKKEVAKKEAAQKANKKEASKKEATYRDAKKKQSIPQINMKTKKKHHKKDFLDEMQAG